MTRWSLSSIQFNSIQLVRDAFTPFELGIRKAARDLENCWGSGGWNNEKGFMHELSCGEGGNGVHSNAQILAVEKKSACNGGCGGMAEERKKGLSIRVPVRAEVVGGRRRAASAAVVLGKEGGGRCRGGRKEEEGLGRVGSWVGLVLMTWRVGFYFCWVISG
ncbi:unnamed protein product [Linum trigynum]|uniref:Uncharacterized protein n=1 Tax=Linum trigynum TaxID=586398 RepID=A0AAV2FYL6_9ROSI